MLRPMISLRPYQTADEPVLVQLMRELQKHIAVIDPFRRVRMPKDSDAEKYVQYLLQKLQDGNGTIFVAEDTGNLLGFIAGSIPEDDPEDLLDHYTAKEGKIHELVVSETHRGRGIGKMLVEKMEEELRAQGCAYIRVGCFAPNTDTHAFYEKNGYSDRYIEMLKKL